MSYPEAVQTEIRRAMLDALADLPDLTLTEGGLAEAVNERTAYRVGGVAVAGYTSWLHQAGLVTRLAVGATAVIALTPRGLDVSRGLDSVPGVARRVREA
ncbi:hypothetical protein ACNQFN_11460 [Thauera butanivorans]|uniref:hypothetical protein n=1 Tax=Thauera butanivorans TaxID=86174 RepID=UPI003AB1A793